MGALLLLTNGCGQPNGADSGCAEWTKEVPGVWRSRVGVPDRVTLTSELTFTPKREAIADMGEADFPIDPTEIRVERIDGKTYLRFPLEEDEQIYGLGLNFKTVEQRKRIMRLHVDHYGGKDDGRTHAPVPFFVSSKGYGVLLNVARYVDVYCGTGVRKDSKHPPVVRDRTTDPKWSALPYSDNLEFLVPAEGVELLMFAGETMLDVVRRFNLYHGGGVLPPKWGLGFWHRVPTRYTDRQVKAEVREFKEHGFPLSVVGLEPGWQSRAYPCTYEWDSTRFPQPQQLIDTLAAQHIRVNLWMNPGVSPESSVYPDIEPLTASHTEWCGVIPDYTLKEAQDIMCRHWTKHQLDLGVSGYKMDENDGNDSWIFPDVATFPSGTSAEQMRQIYGSLMQHMLTNLYRQRNQRTYGLVRAGNAGTVSYPFVIYNDYYNHRDFITALINSSYIGVLWTPEVRSSATAEEWLRRWQTVCFAPIAMLNAWSDGTKPWTFPEVERQVNEVAMLRMQLIPYLYSTYADYCFQGIPPTRAMNLEAGYAAKSEEEAGVLDATDNPYALAVKHESKDQFMVGENLLVAPLFAGETERKVVLPQGRWYDFYTGNLVGEGEIITVAPGLDRIPVFVKDGGIVPMFAPSMTLDDAKRPLLVRHYGSKASTYRLYDDDGETYDYERGEYAYVALKVEVDADGTKHGSAEQTAGTQLWSYNGEYDFQFMTK